MKFPDAKKEAAKICADLNLHNGGLVHIHVLRVQAETLESASKQLRSLKSADAETALRMMAATVRHRIHELQVAAKLRSEED